MSSSDFRAQLGPRFFTHDYEQLEVDYAQLKVSLSELLRRAGDGLMLEPSTPLLLEYVVPVT